jgi:hypothetical protein
MIANLYSRSVTLSNDFGNSIRMMIFHKTKTGDYNRHAPAGDKGIAAKKEPAGGGTSRLASGSGFTRGEEART